MATNANPAPTVKVKANAELKGCIAAILNHEAETNLLYDRYRTTAKAQATKLGITDRKMLTLVLAASGDSDARRVSLICAYVFPTNQANRKTLDKIAALNADAKDNNKRISSDVLKAVQSAKEPMSIEQAKAAVAKAKAERKPGGKTDPVEPAKAKVKKLTPAQIETALGELFDAALQFGDKHGYDLADCSAVMEARAAEIFDSEGSCESDPEDGDPEDGEDDDSSE